VKAPDGGTEAMVSMTRWRLRPGRATSLVRPKRNGGAADTAETPLSVWRCLLVVTLASFALVITLAPARTALAQPRPDEARPTKRIAFLFSDEAALPANLDADRGLRAGFAKDPSFEFEYYVEYLDLARFGSEAYEQRLATVLSEKYAGRHPDLIVCVGPRARWLQTERRARVDRPG